MTAHINPKELADFIRAEANNFDISSWGKREKVPLPGEVGRCRTVACIAGSAVFLNDPKEFMERVLFSERNAESFMRISRFLPTPFAKDWHNRAKELLGFSDGVCHHLFAPNTWSSALEREGYESYYSWNANEHPGLARIKSMQSWNTDNMEPFIQRYKEQGFPEYQAISLAEDYLMETVKAKHAAACLDLLADRPHYVDWQEAFELANG